MQLKNDLILRTSRGEKTERTPVWLMRQAGRVLPEYRAVRAKMGSFEELVKSPEFAAEVTIQPVDILGVDAAIIFSDILVIPDAMGCHYEMIESRGPIFPSPIKTEADVNKLIISNPEEEARLNDHEYQDQIAEAILKGIRNYFAKNPPVAKSRQI